MGRPVVRWSKTEGWLVTGRTHGLQSWLEAFVAAETPAPVVERWSDGVIARVLAQNPEIAEDTVLSALVRASVRAHWMAFLASLLEPQREVHLVQPGAEVAAELARRGHPSTVLFRVYRVAQQAVWEYATSVVGTVPHDDLDEAEVLVFFWSRASTWLDSSIEASVEVYQTERDRIQQGESAQRLDTVRAVLAGHTPDAREVSLFLGGHPISGYNTALLLHTERNDAVSGLDEAAARLGRELGVRQPLVVNPGGRDLWCWLGTRAAPDLAVLHRCDAWLHERGIVVATGTPSQGVDGFRLSHREAQDAQRIAFQAKVPRPLTLFAQVELLSLMSGSPEAAVRFTMRTLDALADQTDSAARLRQTLHALLATGSVEAAARLLSVHKNTVRYRVNQAEALLGRPASTAATEVELALRYFDMFLEVPKLG